MIVCDRCRKNPGRLFVYGDTINEAHDCADLCYECTKELKVYHFYGKDMVEGLYYRKADVDRLIESLNTGNNALLPDPPKPRRATIRELAKWCAQGNGQIQDTSRLNCVFTGIDYGPDCDDHVAPKIYKVRKWEDTEWHEPTVDYMGLEAK